MRRIVLSVVVFLQLVLSSVAFAGDGGSYETIFFLNEDLKSAVSYFSNRSNHVSKVSTFAFPQGYDTKRILYARPENYTWDKERIGDKDKDVLNFFNTNTYAYLEKIVNSSDFLEQKDSTHYVLFIDGSQCAGDGCKLDENIVSAVIPPRLKVTQYKAFAGADEAVGQWKVVDNTYTFYAKDVKGISLRIWFEGATGNLSVEHSGSSTIKRVMGADGAFDSGKAELKDEAKRWLTALLNELSDMDYKEIRVEGHTDNLNLLKPEIVKKYPTNWELSVARASTVVRFLISHGIEPEKIVAVGYGDSRPVAPNKTPDGRSKNRRIEVSIVVTDKTSAAVISNPKDMSKNTAEKIISHKSVAPSTKKPAKKTISKTIPTKGTDLDAFIEKSEKERKEEEAKAEAKRKEVEAKKKEAEKAALEKREAEIKSALEKKEAELKALLEKKDAELREIAKQKQQLTSTK